MKTIPERGYRYLPDSFQYSAGIATLPGFAFRRVRFERVVPLSEGFDWIEAYCAREGLARTAFVACELRSPAPLSPEGFRTFNTSYAERLRAWGIFEGDENPVARSNVCPKFEPPKATGFHAFTVVVPQSESLAPSFVVSGGAETRPGTLRPAERIVSYRDVSAAGMSAKMNQTLTVIGERLAGLGARWADTTAIQVYTVFELPTAFPGALANLGGCHGAIAWQLCRPPVEDVDFEIDCRRVGSEFVVSP